MKDREISDHLNLGCGLNAPDGWLNVDASWQVVLARRKMLKRLLVLFRLLPSQQAEIPWNPGVMRLNLTRPLPFVDNTFQAVYSSHLLEHLYFDHALNLLKECHRIIVPGGGCRVVVPDLSVIIEKYLLEKKHRKHDAATRFMESMMVHDKKPTPGVLGLFYRLTAFHSHKWMYDVESLKQLFKEAGFKEVREADYLDSSIARIKEVEDAERVCHGQGIVVESIKS